MHSWQWSGVILHSAIFRVVIQKHGRHNSSSKSTATRRVFIQPELQTTLSFGRFCAWRPHTDKNRLWLLCVLSSIVRSDLNVQLRCASSSTSTVSSVSLCIVHIDYMLSVSSSNMPPHSSYLTCSLIISLLLVSLTVSLNMYFVTNQLPSGSLVVNSFRLLI
jgi:hypothetical protein